jgi:hypothetical protein
MRLGQVMDGGGQEVTCGGLEVLDIFVMWAGSEMEEGKMYPP